MEKSFSPWPTDDVINDMERGDISVRHTDLEGRVAFLESIMVRPEGIGRDEWESIAPSEDPLLLSLLEVLEKLSATLTRLECLSRTDSKTGELPLEELARRLTP